MYSLTPYIVLFPLIGFLINGLFGKKLNSEKLSGIIGSGTIGISFVFAALIFFNMLGQPSEERSHIVSIFNWIAAGSFSADVAYQVDQLSILMTLVVTGVGFLIHVYSIGYMHGDAGFWRFFSYLNLFIFMMLNLVLANNFLLMFLGWEGVGLCSFLLIGFWHDQKFDTGGYQPGSAMTTDAAKKAFIVNRIGDFGFLIAMFLIFNLFGSLKFDDVFSRASSLAALGDTAIFWVTLLLFLGATGKSAQIPLFIWLPDAMAGPTPVSALIHAATMVTAGVYMVARCSILYALAPATMEIVAVVGAATAFFAATMGLVQNDIKKVLAYSTVSQLGYMFLALGVGSFTAGIFHVMTHAFFKALLFLGAGSVIHALHEQDIQKMGGLKSAMPTTYKTFLIAALAIAGIPPLSGFFSKDEILFRAFSQGSTVLWLVAWVTAGLTAFYMFRLVLLTFEGDLRWSHEKHPHESPKVMTVPLLVLAALSVIGGFIGIPSSLGGENAIERWLEPVFQRAESQLALTQGVSYLTEYVLMALSVVAGVAGIALARRMYLQKDRALIQPKGAFYKLLWNKYYVDEVYDAAIVAPMVKGSEKLLWRGFDVAIIDGIVNGVAKLIGLLSDQLRKIQVGVAQTYALAFVIGIIVVLGILVFR
ncbi:MAG: NADH-quinone oxidoreductase subunit L [Ignavibacteriae bacterium]|nr:NADH-quinone oxidoreductase subunit L [Ignavibacteria bacterium]MBI3365529.1 NADH-quinone oxidoreductase subunit L [Ignavibacteriota bacterium]